MHLGVISSHDGTLSLVDRGQHLFALGEERLNRRKSYIGFPFSALRYAVDKKVIDPTAIKSVSVAQQWYPKGSAEVFAFTLNEDKKYYDIQNDPRPDDFFIAEDRWRSIKTDEECEAYVKLRITELLAQSGISAPIRFYDHHECHAASAYYSSGLHEALAITMDGEGDELSATVSLCRDGKISRLSATDRIYSAGYLYSAVTKRCGFKVSRHEGKITGLAAYGKYEPHIGKLLDDVFVENGQLRVKGLRGYSLSDRVIRRAEQQFGIERPFGMAEVISRLGPISNEDLAAVVQELLERRISEIARYWVEKTGVGDVVLAGGVFANVKFNQRVGELDCVKSLFVFPDMGDGGTAYGAAMLADVEQNGFEPKRSFLKDVYLGPEFGDAEIATELDAHDWLVHRRSDDIATDTAALVAAGKIVGWFQGRMEYGPRALGNRSVVARATDASINKWLNDRMRRTEFMPFAPSCLYERADEVFEIPNPELKRPAEFMTITFAMKPSWIEKTPAVAHVDGTARPQLVRAETNPLYHRMISEYERLTGLPLVINTSFNVHEEPIVCAPAEAVAALQRGMIDVLAIGNYLVERRAAA